MCFQGGGFKSSRHWQQRLRSWQDCHLLIGIRKLSVSKQKEIKTKQNKQKKCIEFNANRFSFPNTVKLNHLFFCQPCIHCWTASQFHWSPLWQASPTLVLSYCPCPRMRCCVSSPPFSTEVKRKQVSLWRFFRGFPRNMVAERKWN